MDAAAAPKWSLYSGQQRWTYLFVLFLSPATVGYLLRRGSQQHAG